MEYIGKTWNAMEYHVMPGIPWNAMEYHGISWIITLGKHSRSLQGTDLGKEAIRRLSGFTASGRSVVDELEDVGNHMAMEW